jgi:DeoR family transcriptional regulator, copper-sensing transcriptional repressor
MDVKKIVPALIMFSLLMVMVGLVQAGELKRCIVCGMDVSKYPHTRYVVTTMGGEEFVTCGAQCGLTLHLRFKDKFKSATATDLLSNRPVDARKAFYVYKSSVITDMAPGFIVFAVRKNAENFARGFGGQVVTYDEALVIWKKQVQ